MAKKPPKIPSVIRLILPSFEIITAINGERILKRIEVAGRIAYKSEARITAVSAKAFVQRIIAQGHESVLEHESISVKFICDRGVSHELARHRLASMTQESTRFVDYAKEGDDRLPTFVIPPWVNIEPGIYEDTDIALVGLSPHDVRWVHHCFAAAHTYKMLREHDKKVPAWAPQQARAVLPHSTKTEIVFTANLREWRHILKLRTDKAAHPQMRQLMIPLCVMFKALLPTVFEDIKIDDERPEQPEKRTDVAA